MTPSKKPVVLYFGKYKGIVLPKVPLSHLCFIYGSFTHVRNVVEGEMRRRGLVDADFIRIQKRFPVKAKYPTRQQPSNPPPHGPIHIPLPVVAPCPLESLGTSRLMNIYAESGGTDKAAEEELRTRGYNTRELIEVERQHQQKKWLKERKKASKVTRKKKKNARNTKNLRHRLRKAERRRQEQIDKVARLKDGVVIVGENFDPSASDGSCPF